MANVPEETAAGNPEFDVSLYAQNLQASIDIGPVTTARSARSAGRP
ncbi:hypothetical protein [Streptomyces sp. LARHCF252]